MKIWLLVACIAAVVVNGGESKPKTDTQKTKSSDTVKQPNAPVPVPVMVVNQNASGGEADNHTNKPPSYLSRLFSPENLPNIALVVIGFFGVGAALLTLLAIKGQLKATHNAERPWLGVKVEDFEAPHVQNYAGLVWINAPITNSGRTPARIKRIFMTEHRVPMSADSTRPGELPKIPEYNFLDQKNTLIEGRDLIVFPNQTIEYARVYLWPDDLAPILDRERSLYVYGFVEYIDTLTEAEHKTCFCSLYWVPKPTVNEPTGFAYSGIIPPKYFCAT